MELQPHEQRVVVEKQELDERLHKLRTFIASDTFGTIADRDRELLTHQATVMNSYSEILAARIERFRGARLVKSEEC